MRISDWSSDVCSSDLVQHAAALQAGRQFLVHEQDGDADLDLGILRHAQEVGVDRAILDRVESDVLGQGADGLAADFDHHDRVHENAGHQLLHQQLFLDVDHQGRSEEHTSELQSLMRISYAVFCLKKKNRKIK